MERSLKLANRNNRSTVAITLADDRMIVIGLFLIALWPRLLALGKFITADEPRWAIRSVSFLTGLLTTDWLLTLDTPGHPGVTTMWSGTLGLIMDYALNHQAAGSLLAFVQSLPDNYQRIDPTVLPWMRLPIVVLAAVSVAAIFWFLRSLNRNLAIIAALLLAFHPLHLAHSQLLHHDALVSIFALFSIMFYLTALRRWSWTLIALSGVMAGLAFLSKSTAYALIPFVGLVMLVELFSRRQTFRQAVLAGLLWVGAALVSVIALWPAIWVAPLDVWQTVYNWINQSAEAGSILETLSAGFSEGFPDLGVFFYPVNWLLKTTPLMMLGLLFFIFWWRRASSASQARWWAGRLLLWIGLFSLMLTLGDKRDGRYLLPIYFALCILAALGLQFIYQRLKHLRPFRVNLRVAQTNAYQIGFAILLVGFSVTFYPYYLTYYNPLAGGSWAAAKLIRVGWGDGMEEAAAWLNAQPNAGQLRVATIIEQSFWPFFDGQIAPPDTHRTHSADYVLNYHRQIQNGVPFREFWEYYRARPAAFKLRVAGIDYVWLHQEPPLAKIDRIPFGDRLILRAYTTDQPLAAPGRPLDVTLIWRTNSPTQDVARLQLRDEAGHLQAESEPAPVIDPNGPSAVEGHYSLNLPEALPRGTYPLWVSVGEKDDWTEVAAIPVGRTAPATDIRDPLEVNFAHRILLRGFEFSPSVVAPGTSINLEFHWQAVQPMMFAFTTFIHLRDGEGQVVAQSDVQPGQGRWPTNTWNRHEWITDHVSLALPADLPTGDYQLWAGWYHLESGQRLPLADDETEDSVLLGTITVP
jgi:hypothetical protein